MLLGLIFLTALDHCINRNSFVFKDEQYYAIP